MHDISRSRHIFIPLVYLFEYRTNCFWKFRLGERWKMRSTRKRKKCEIIWKWNIRIRKKKSIFFLVLLILIYFCFNIEFHIKKLVNIEFSICRTNSWARMRLLLSKSWQTETSTKRKLHQLIVCEIKKIVILLHRTVLTFTVDSVKRFFFSSGIFRSLIWTLIFI